MEEIRWTITPKVTASFDDPTEVDSVKVIFMFAGISVTATYSDPNGADANDWLSLLGSKNTEIVFCNSNGNVGVGLKDGVVYFEVGKYGAGGDGDIVIQAPQSYCAPAIKEIANRVREIQGDA